MCPPTACLRHKSLQDQLQCTSPAVFFSSFLCWKKRVRFPPSGESGGWQAMGSGGFTGSGRRWMLREVAGKAQARTQEMLGFLHHCVTTPDRDS